MSVSNPPTNTPVVTKSGSNDPLWIQWYVRVTAEINKAVSNVAAVWGQIAGNLSDQKDLKAALDAKADATALSGLATTDFVNGVLTGIGADFVKPIQDQNQTFHFADDTGAANAYAATLAPVVSAYVAGLRVAVKIANANTTASTLAVNGLTATAIKKESSAGLVDLSAGDLQAGGIYVFTYDGTVFQLAAGGFSNPMTTLGDTLYEDATPAAARLPGNTTSTKKFLTQTGTGSVSAAPGWNTIAQADVPAFTGDSGSGGTLGGVPAPAAGDAAANKVLKADGTWGTVPSGFTNPMTTLGDLIYEDATPTATRLPGNTTTTKKFLRQTGTGSVSAVPAWDTVTASDVGLGNVTNDAQTKAAIVPNTAPSAGQILVGNAGGTAYAPVSVTGATLSSAGVLTVTDANLSVSDITTNNVSTSAHGFAPKAPNNVNQFLRADASWATPSGGSGTNAVKNIQTGTGTFTGNNADQTTYTYTIPAGTLSVGSLVRVQFGYFKTGGSGSVTMKFWFGAASISQALGTGTGSAAWEARVIVNGSSAQTLDLMSTLGSVESQASGSEAISGSIVVKFTIAVPSPSTWVGQYWMVEILNA